MKSLCLMSAVSLASWLLVGAIRRWCEQRGILDIPNHRSSHSQPISRGGGLAITVTTLGIWLVSGWLGPLASRGMILPFACGGLLIGAISWLDDLRTISNRVRFAIHSLGAIIAISSYGY